MRYFKKYADLNMQKMCSRLNLITLKTYFCCGYHGIRLLPKIFSRVENVVCFCRIEQMLIQLLRHSETVPCFLEIPYSTTGGSGNRINTGCGRGAESEGWAGPEGAVWGWNELFVISWAVSFKLQYKHQRGKKTAPRECEALLFGVVRCGYHGYGRKHSSPPR